MCVCVRLQCWRADHGSWAGESKHEEVPHVEPLPSGHQQQGVKRLPFSICIFGLHTTSTPLCCCTVEGFHPLEAANLMLCSAFLQFEQHFLQHLTACILIVDNMCNVASHTMAVFADDR